MTKKLKISNKEIKDLLAIESIDFPKYTTQIINLANQNAQATRPAVVGQMSELIQEFSGKSITEWEQWYLKKYPSAIKEATEKILQMIENLKHAMAQIDKKLVENWVRDLVIIKTFIGLKFQEAVLKKVAILLKTDYRLAEPEEESKGIDGFIGDVPVSIKPHTYKIKKNLNEKISVKIIYYQKAKDGIYLDLKELIS